jgi:hypothetical protein
MKSIRKLITHEPTLLCPGYGKPYPVDQSILLATEQDLRIQQRRRFDVLPDGAVDFGLNPSWPYQSV